MLQPFSLNMYFTDALVGSRGYQRERGVQERVLSALLTEMDGIGVQTDSFSNGSQVYFITYYHVKN